MRVNNCLITAAGLGTRMGIIGENLPKPLWPIFDKTLLDIQLEYVKRFNPEKIFINAHHNSHKIIEWAKDKNITVLVEDELLGSGGCIHNLKKSSESMWPVTVVVNSDQFFLLDKEKIDIGLKKIENGFDSVIYGLVVNKTEKYNETIYANDRLVNICKATGDEDYYTFSGVSIINLEKLTYVEGESSFFNSVCNYKNNENIYFMSGTEKVKFWDFGTKPKYVESLFRVLKDDGEMRKLIEQSGVELKQYENEKEKLSFNLYKSKINKENGEIEIDSIIDQI